MVTLYVRPHLHLYKYKKKSFVHLTKWDYISFLLLLPSDNWRNMQFQVMMITDNDQWWKKQRSMWQHWIVFFLDHDLQIPQNMNVEYTMHSMNVCKRCVQQFMLLVLLLIRIFDEQHSTTEESMPFPVCRSPLIEFNLQLVERFEACWQFYDVI